MTRSRIMPVVVLLMPAVAAALEPCTRSNDAYRQRFEELVVETIPETFVIAADVYPAFDGEWSARIVRDEDGFQVKLVQFDESLWYAAHSQVDDTVKREFAGTTVDTVADDSPVTEEFAVKLAVEWRYSIANSAESDWMGFDGVSYRFRLPDGSCGQTWSPTPLHRDFLLVGMIWKLRDIAISDSSIPNAELEGVVSKVLDELERIR